MLYCKSFTKPVFSIALSFHHLFMLHDQIIFIIKTSHYMHLGFVIFFSQHGLVDSLLGF